MTAEQKINKQLSVYSSIPFAGYIIKLSKQKQHPINPTQIPTEDTDTDLCCIAFYYLYAEQEIFPYIIVL